MAGFLDLPIEIRNIIYRLCLMSHNEIVPDVTPYESHQGVRASDTIIDALSLGLLLTSRVIREEARLIFYGDNSFRLTDCEDDEEPLNSNNQILYTNRDALRHVVLTIDISNYARLVASYTAYPNYGASDLPLINAKERMQDCHDRTVAAIQDQWRDMLSYMFTLCLTSLTLDIDNTFCLNGCCRIGLNFLRDKLKPIMNNVSSALHADSSLTTAEQVDLSVFEYHLGSQRRPDQLVFTAQRVLIRGLFGRAEYERAHSHGFGCMYCPLKDQHHDTSRCKWKDILQEMAAKDVEERGDSFDVDDTEFLYSDE